MLPMLPSIIFDLDGTLWDSSEQVAASWNEVLHEFVGDVYSFSRETVLAQMGLVMEDIGRNITPKSLQGEDKENFVKACFMREVEYLQDHPGKLFQDEIITLRALKEKGYHLYIVSNCQSGYIETYLNALDEPLFEGHMCYDDTKKSKDFTIRTLMERHHIEKAVYVGDTATDEAASRGAGIPFIFASYGFGKAKDPDASITSISELPAALDSLLSR